jgi:hypothetical protein
MVVFMLPPSRIIWPRISLYVCYISYDIIHAEPCQALLKGVFVMSSQKPLTSAQIRAARALIRWSAQELANASSVGVTTIRRAELTESETKLTRANDQAIRRALEAAGVEFIDAEGGGPGVRLGVS